MGKREQMREKLDPLMLPGREHELAEMLLANSNLPGPRGNLELAAEFAAACAHPELPDSLLSLLVEWMSGRGMSDPAHPAAEFLPCCAVQALGAHYSHATPRRQTWIEQNLRTMANSTLWRVRESAAIALQLMAEHDFAATVSIMQNWLASSPSFLEARAVVAASAHPPILGHDCHAKRALDMLVDTTRLVSAAQDRRADGFRVLRQALEYALSVIVAALPGPGFVVLEQLAESEDRDIQRIVRENLKKNRLKRFVIELAKLQDVLDNCQCLR